MSSRRKFRLGKSELSELYLEQGMSSPHIARLYAVDKATVLNALKRYGIPRRTRRRLPPVNRLRHLYFVEGKTLQEIGDMFGVTGAAVGMEFRKHAVPTGAPERRTRRKRSKPWPGDTVKYSTAHLRVEKELGKPMLCARCGERSPGVKYVWHNLSGDYEEPSDYVRLCSKCHCREHARLRKRQVLRANARQPSVAETF